MFSAELLQVAREIVLVWGAVCIILTFFVLFYVLLVLNKISRTVWTVKKTVNYAMGVAQVPMTLIQRLFVDSDDDF